MDNYLEMVRKAKHGSADAFACLYQEIYEDLYRFAVYILKNPADAQDIVSDTVMDAYEAIHKLRAEEAFKGWIFRILYNKCRAKLKEYANKTVELSQEVTERASMSACDSETAEHIQIRMMFWELPPEDRMIIAMHLFAGYTSREIAAQLHMNENTVRSRESRALKRMKDQWNRL